MSPVWFVSSRRTQKIFGKFFFHFFCFLIFFLFQLGNLKDKEKARDLNQYILFLCIYLIERRNTLFKLFECIGDRVTREFFGKHLHASLFHFFGIHNRDSVDDRCNRITRMNGCSSGLIPYKFNSIIIHRDREFTFIKPPPNEANPKKPQRPPFFVLPSHIMLSFVSILACRPSTNTLAKGRPKKPRTFPLWQE